MSNENRETPDQLLVKRVQAGDKAAFDLLVRKYQHKVVGLISRYIYDHHEALDVAQEAFVKAWRALPRFRGDSAFYTWLYRIAINTAKNHLVARSRRPPDTDVDAEEAGYFSEDSMLREIETPENVYFRDELQQSIDRVLKRLPEDLRVALTLREMEGMSYEEIAQIMGCPVGTVRSRIFRAREAIDTEIAPMLRDYD